MWWKMMLYRRLRNLISYTLPPKRVQPILGLVPANSLVGALALRFSLRT